MREKSVIVYYYQYPYYNVQSLLQCSLSLWLYHKHIISGFPVSLSLIESIFVIVTKDIAVVRMCW